MNKIFSEPFATVHENSIQFFASAYTFVSDGGAVSCGLVLRSIRTPFHPGRRQPGLSGYISNRLKQAKNIIKLCSDMEHLKKELIAKHMIPLFGSEDRHEVKITDRLTQICKLHKALKYEQLEAPGPFEQARVFFSLEGMIHSYYYCPHKFVPKGTRIWKRLSFILFSSCLLEREERSDYVQMLEPGKVLSFSYQDLLNLMEDFPPVSLYFGHVFNSNESYYHHRNILLNKPPVERTRQLNEENPYFIKVASQQIQAMHVNLSLRGYVNQIKKLR